MVLKGSGSRYSEFRISLAMLKLKMNDRVAAHMWFNLAGETQERERLATLMKPEEIMEAQRTATEWTAHR